MNIVNDSQNVLSGTLPQAKCPFSRRFLLGKRAGSGQVTVEMALICLPFFAILFAAIDLGQIYFYENAIQNAMREAARFGTAGRIIQAKDANGLPLYTNYQGISYPVAIQGEFGEASRNECIRLWFNRNCVVSVDPTNITVVSVPTLPGVKPVTSFNQFGRMILESGATTIANPDGTVTTNIVNEVVKGPGGKDDYMQITVHYEVKCITPIPRFLGGYTRNWSTFAFTASAIVKNESSIVNFHHLAYNTNEIKYYDPTWSTRP